MLTDYAQLLKLTVALLLISWGISANAQSNASWSGSAHYAVTPLVQDSTDWDYLPLELDFETNGNEWKISERGTSFERNWYGQFGSENYRVFFHFLGHAVELLEPCQNESNDTVIHAEDLGRAPCCWGIAQLPLQIELQDGPARYTINLTNHEAIRSDKWPENHFEFPDGYEPMEREDLAALLYRISMTSE